MSHTTATAARRTALRDRLRGNAVRIAAVTVTAAAALTLTACGSDDSSGTKTEGKADSAPAMESAGHDSPGKSGANGSAGTGDTAGTGGTAGGDSAGTGGTGNGGEQGGTDSAARPNPKGPGIEGAKEQPTAGNNASGSGSQGGSNSGSDAGATDKPCTTAGSKLSLERTGGTMPAITLRITNTGSTACNAYHAPLIGYPGAQAPLAVGDKPQSVHRLLPGESTTATIALGSEDGSNPHREQQLTVTLQDANGAPLSGRATVSAPAGAGLLLDDDSSVSYWGAGLGTL